MNKLFKKEFGNLNKKSDRIIDLLNKKTIQNDVSSNDSDLYFRNGISKDVTASGGVKLRDVELLKSRWKAKSGLYALVVSMQPEYLCFIDNTHSRSKQIYDLIKDNQNRNHFTSGQYGQHLDEMVLMKNGKRVRAKSVDGRTIIVTIPNHLVVANGEYSKASHEHWDAKLLKMIPVWFEARMQGDFDVLNSHKFY